MAIAPDGSVAGVSDVRVDDERPGSTARSASRSSTRPTAAAGSGWRSSSRPTTWRWRRTPSCSSVDTSNAEVNTWMNAVNEALGYRTIETLLELQKKL